ncbi:cytidine deaminase-like protein [Calocera cornea HHB12733]|uniref:Cytidine deaminase-like protein n=1 Tax=Calocera cornea HHB12733 TaxID=1353952 RepID=A0A165DMH2_9BASI|nr:cytidine deaminase-like protein [Calocera cornea HHB12733]
MDAPTAFSSGAPMRHLNTLGLGIRTTPDKGRGVYATSPLARGTLIEVSPVLLFTPQEWEEHGRHTVLDHYTFIWRIPGQPKPSMALALGLGSMFNHSSRPNVSFNRNIAAQTIEYTTTRDIAPEEELCISYGDSARLWFPVVDDADRRSESDQGEWGGLDGVEIGGVPDEEPDRFAEETMWEVGNTDEIMPAPELPFQRIKSLEELEEEETDAIKTMNVWVVDVDDPRMISSMLRFLKENALDTPELNHLRRVRKVNNHAILLLSTGPPPPLPGSLPAPYLYAVPRLAAKDQDDLQRKNLVWPVEPIMRTQEERRWTRAEVAWVVRGLKRAISVAREAGLRGEVPVGTYVCNAPGEEEIEAVGVDTRLSANHPLRHSVMAAVRGIADIRVVISPSASTSVSTRISAEGSPASSAPVSRSGTPSLTASKKNGADYLLTSLTLFTTHEPCIMCSMALVHSRVKDVFYVQGMPGTGGCGGAEGRGCGVVGKGVNHRFGVWRWTGEGLRVPDVSPGTDA